MIKAAVFSDTHKKTALMVEAVRRSRPDMIIHLGDHESDSEILRMEFPEIPLYSVCGNCDLCPQSPEKETIQIGPVKAFITHGHLYNVKWSVMSLAYAAWEEGCKLALFGHTHEPFNEDFSGVRLVNPGSAGDSRHPTWALVSVMDNGGMDISIKDL